MQYRAAQQKEKELKKNREESISIALRMIKRGGYTAEQIMVASGLTRREIQGLCDNTPQHPPLL